MSLATVMPILLSSVGKPVMVYDDGLPFDALIIGIEDHAVFPYIHHRTTDGDDGTFGFDLRKVTFSWPQPRTLLIEEEGAGRLEVLL